MRGEATCADVGTDVDSEGKRVVGCDVTSCTGEIPAAVLTSSCMDATFLMAGIYI